MGKKEHFDLKIGGKKVRFIYDPSDLEKLRQFEEKQEKEMEATFRPFIRQYNENKTINHG